MKSHTCSQPVQDGTVWKTEKPPNLHNSSSYKPCFRQWLPNTNTAVGELNLKFPFWKQCLLGIPEINLSLILRYIPVPPPPWGCLSWDMFLTRDFVPSFPCVSHVHLFISSLSTSLEHPSWYDPCKPTCVTFLTSFSLASYPYINSWQEFLHFTISCRGGKCGQNA